MEKRESSEQDEVTSRRRLEAEYHRNKAAPVRHQGGVMTEEQYELLRRQIAAFAALSEMLVDTYNSLLRQHQSFPTRYKSTWIPFYAKRLVIKEKRMVNQDC